MKKSTLLLVMILFNYNISAREINKAIHINSLTASVQQNNFDIGLNLDLSEYKLERGNSLYLYPILASKNDTIRLPHIIINSRSAQQSYRRYPNHHRYKGALIVQQFRKRASHLDYHITTPYRQWMQHAQLLIYKADCFCGAIQSKNLIIKEELNRDIKRGTRENVSKNRYRMTIQSVDSIPYEVPEYRPTKEFHKIRSEQGEAYLSFKQGKYDLLYNYKENSRKLTQVASFFNRVVRDRDIEVTAIDIVGYCSVEGSYHRNIKLSHDRATSFLNWLQNRYPELLPHLFHVEWRGEDWDKLTSLIESSNYIWKYSALDIIHRYNLFEGREAMLMKMLGGTPYRAMYKNFFPQLRRVTYRITYNVRPFKVEDSQEIIDHSPHKLSIFEMYALANAYGRGSNEFYKTIDKAAETYPTDLIAINNATAFALSRGEHNRALEMLTNTPDGADKFNNLGVLFALKREFNKAVYWFERAIELHSEEAVKNLKSIQVRLNSQYNTDNSQPRQIRIPF